uniref:Cytosolic Fe-S cluster assembly factor NUBP1 homolog n=1 Tax=Brugia timori TaxID=42155 RepID=A0A0R3RBX7_9BILA
LDYLLIDTPPGTSDEHISIVQFLLQAGSVDGAIIVTTPQEISLLDVRKEINFCRRTKINILGIVENMSSFICPCCSNVSQLFPRTTGGAEMMCNELSVPLLALLPFDSHMAKCADSGEDYFEKYRNSALAKEFEKLAQLISK